MRTFLIAGVDHPSKAMQESNRMAFIIHESIPLLVLNSPKKKKKRRDKNTHRGRPEAYLHAAHINEVNEEKRRCRRPQSHALLTEKGGGGEKKKKKKR